MLEPFVLLRQLADGRLYSGQQLADRYGVSRMSISHAINQLRSAGIAVDALPDGGYRIRQRLELLHDKVIWQTLNAETQAYISDVEVFPQLDSTSSHLLREASQGAPSGRVCLAELQTAGKGRRGRSWVSPLALNLYLSLLWRFEDCSGPMAGLSLLIGVGLARVMESYGVKSIGLKWPNDLLHLEKKLGGILLEMVTETDGSCYLVVGVGVNFHMPHQYGRSIEQPWTDLTSVLGGTVPSRNDVAARVIESIVDSLQYFAGNGLAGLPSKWHPYDCTAGKPVELHTPQGMLHGCGAGVDELGRFVLERDGNRRAYPSGEVSLRRRS